MDHRVAVIGGANIDIYGVTNTLKRKDSNIGKIYFQHGGVGRNIAETLGRLVTDVLFITATGDDVFSVELLKLLRDLDVNVEHVVRLKEQNSNMYVAIIGPDGDMEIAVNDMEAMESLLPKHIEMHKDYLNHCSVLVPDANLPQETLAYIAENFSHLQLIFDPVSTAKAERSKKYLKYFHTLKMNAYEAAYLTGYEDPLQAAKCLMQGKTKQVFITQGKDGTLAMDYHKNVIEIPSYQAEVKNATGAGDAFTAGVAYTMLQHWPLKECGYFASACAAMALESLRPVNPEITYFKVMDIIKQQSGEEQS